MPVRCVTIQREIEDHLSEKILFGEIGAGEIVTVDVENWDGEGKGEREVRLRFQAEAVAEIAADDEGPTADEA